MRKSVYSPAWVSLLLFLNLPLPPLDYSQEVESQLLKTWKLIAGHDPLGLCNYAQVLGKDSPGAR